MARLSHTLPKGKRSKHGAVISMTPAEYEARKRAEAEAA
jgi:hypothetical protein